jgi:hypothetical protein
MEKLGTKMVKKGPAPSAEHPQKRPATLPYRPKPVKDFRRKKRNPGA